MQQIITLSKNTVYDEFNKCTSKIFDEKLKPETLTTKADIAVFTKNRRNFDEN